MAHLKNDYILNAFQLGAKVPHSHEWAQIFDIHIVPRCCLVHYMAYYGRQCSPDIYRDTCPAIDSVQCYCRVSDSGLDRCGKQLVWGQCRISYWDQW